MCNAPPLLARVAHPHAVPSCLPLPLPLTLLGTFSPQKHTPRCRCCNRITAAAVPCPTGEIPTVASEEGDSAEGAATEGCRIVAGMPPPPRAKYVPYYVPQPD